MPRTRFATGWVLYCALFGSEVQVAAETQTATPPPAKATPAETQSGPRRAELEKAFAKMLSGATLEGSYTSTGPGGDPAKLSQEKYMLGEVRKLDGNLWLIPARIQYAEHDVTLPIIVPVRWAGDTPVITVDNLGLEPFGTVSARVMFFDNHYAGYWKHGQHGGHLFGLIRPKNPNSK